MDAILEALQWGTEAVPSPGSHSTLPEDDVLPWQCISEVTPGLYLTCASEVAEKTKCVEHGMSLVINLCGEAYVTKYRVFEKDGSGSAHTFRKFDSQGDFLCELNEYCRAAVATPKEQRRVFVVTIPAEDTPTYNIDQHFLECAVLIELVLRSRACLEPVSEEHYTSAPAVAVHCMVGVSRSASVVIAYFIKKYGLSRDEAMSFVRCTRPVVQPNPGFQRQLSIWETLRGCRVVDEWSAKALAIETRVRANLADVVAVMLPIILRTNKCDNERRFFGALVRSAHPSEGELHAVYRELRSVVAADVDSEVYTDIPNYFGYVAEVVCALDEAAPEVLLYATDFRSGVVCSDAFYSRVVKDVARSGFEKDPFDTTRGFSSLFEAIFVKHLRVRGSGRPVTLAPCSAAEELPLNCALSFPFLFLVAPYAEGFVQFSEWGALADAYPTTGDVLSPADVRHLQHETLRIFLQFFFQASCAATESAARESYTKLSFLQDDLELTTFRKLGAALLASPGAALTSLDSSLPEPASVSGDFGFLLLCKAMSAVVAVRLLLEAAEQFVSQTYGARLGTCVSLAEELLSLSVIADSLTKLEHVCVAAQVKPGRAADFFRSELASLLDTGVLNSAGVASLFQSLS